MRHLYLHGFASGPMSRKAQSFRRALAWHGLELEIPDLAEGDFGHLTISGQLTVVERTLHGEAACLVGSSMGGYIAALYAAGHPDITRLVLLAPAFSFASRWELLTGHEKLRLWRDTGWLDVYHYGDKCDRRVHFGLFEDALRHPLSPDFGQPALILHGVHDVTVPCELSRAFVERHPSAELVELDSDHELLNVLPEVVERGIAFLLPAK
jgi:pimeloyl-ACP methyl ester carboxylesterase